MTLALLLTAVTGAWATETPIATILASENSTFVSGSKTFADKVKSPSAVQLTGSTTGGKLFMTPRTETKEP